MTPNLAYTLYLADNALIFGHRLSEWCGHAPEMEIDMAFANISLDLLGEARSLYQYAAEQEGNGKTEDDYPYLRPEAQFCNILLAEQPNENFAHTIAKHFYFDAFHYCLLQELCRSADATLAAIAQKSLKEVSYHWRFSSEWVLRLGDGTAQSKQLMQHAIDELWMFTGEMTTPSATENNALAAGIAPDLLLIKPLWEAKIEAILSEATLSKPTTTWMQQGGKNGKHSEYLGYVLTEMQYLQRSYPNAKW
jgi:ring-1,2-phenylacetyl-CoA epoxidase subunit PaaC